MILLDTHTWLWWMHDPSRLSKHARAAIEAVEPRNGALVSAISAWEVAVKVDIGKLVLPLPLEEWYEGARRFPGIEVEPLAAEDALASVTLPGELHRDPADRILAAIAFRRGIPLVTRDRALTAYPHVRTLW